MAKKFSELSLEQQIEAQSAILECYHMVEAAYNELMDHLNMD